MDFVWVEPGEFTMGVTEEEREGFRWAGTWVDDRMNDELPAHEVTLSQGFYLGRYEITQGQWESVLAVSPWQNDRYMRVHPDHPAVHISWDDVREFTQVLNASSSGAVYRLPTEAEWEFACRAGTRTFWSFGVDLDTLKATYGYPQLRASAWAAGNACPSYDDCYNCEDCYVRPVGTKLPNPWGIHDMHGSVWEWVYDWYGSYLAENQTDPHGPAFGALRVLRGGDITGHPFDPLHHLRTTSAFRRSASPDLREVLVGARLVRLELPAPPGLRADAGLDLWGPAGTSFTLSGSGTSSPPGEVLTYLWSENPGNPAVGLLPDATSPDPVIHPPVPGLYRFTLQVSDGQATSAPDEVSVLVSAAAPDGAIVVDIPGGPSLELVWVEPGTFTMGTTADQEQLLRSQGVWFSSNEREMPTHAVTFTRGFYLAKHEVTQELWQSTLGTNPWVGMPDAQADPRRPASWISWSETQQLIAELNRLTGTWEFSLPTESQWEYACRAGSQDLWHFGNEDDALADYAWYYSNTWHVGLEAPQPVGTKLPNPWGLHDMLGNVREWCQSWYGDYSSAARTNPTGPLSGTGRVRRGGDFHTRATRPSERFAALPTFRHAEVGARLAAQRVPMAIAVSRPPVALAGEDQWGDPGDTFVLDGSASSDPLGRSLSYAWSEHVDNPGQGLLSDPSSASVRVELRERGTYRFGLVVDNGASHSVADEVAITVRGVPTRPTERLVTYQLPNGLTMDFVWIEPGTFTMGLTADQEETLRGLGSWQNWYEWAKPPHEVTITHGFYLARHEITRAQWESEMGTRPWEDSHHGAGQPQPPDSGNYPADYISWHDVQELVRRLNLSMGKSVFRLPTEAEWEYAARAGTSTLWSFGDDRDLLDQYARTSGLGPVGDLLPNAWGLYNMIGNAREWCHDSFAGYGAHAVVDPVPVAGEQRSVREWISAYRHRQWPGERQPRLGARLVMWGPDLFPPEPTPQLFVLDQSYPNPFTDEVTIGYDLPQSGLVELAVYSILGQKVAVLASGTQSDGPHQVQWDGRGTGGTRLASGVYFCRLVSSGQHATRKLMLLR